MGDVVRYQIWRGRRFNERTIDMIQEAESILGKTFTVTQGGFNSGAVAQSAGTHDGAAVDFSGLMTSREVLAFRTVGFAIWPRPYIKNLWRDHTHGIPMGDDDLSASAERQERDYRNGLNGLANKAKDPYPRPKKIMTWEEYLRSKPSKGGINVATAVDLWGYTNKTLENRDAYAILRSSESYAKTVPGRLLATKYKEYVDENGNNVRDFRTLADIWYATHGNSVLANAQIAALTKTVELLAKAVEGQTGLKASEIKAAITESVTTAVKSNLGPVDIVISADGTLEIQDKPDWVIDDNDNE